jgi:hypothetical protein
MLELIVTGTARSGTLYMARVLTSLGLPCGHESVFNYETKESILRFRDASKRTLSTISIFDEISRIENVPIPLISEPDSKLEQGKWIDPTVIVADSSYMAMPYLNYKEIKKVPVIHVIRNPLAVISSMVLDFKYFTDEPDEKVKPFQTWIYKQIPKIQSYNNPIDRACFYYIEWNLQIEEKCRNRPYIKIGIQEELKKNFFDFLGIPPTQISIGRKVNSLNLRNFTYQITDIPSDELRNDMHKYFRHLLRNEIRYL